MPPPLGGPVGRAGWFGRIVATLATCALLVIAVMFSVAVLAVALVVGAILLGWLWWKMRRLRRAMQGPHAAGFEIRSTGDTGQTGGEIIEGEVLKGEWKDDQRS